PRPVLHRLRYQFLHLLLLVARRLAVLVPHRLLADVVVRGEVNHVRADALLVEILEVRRPVHRSAAAVAGDDRGAALGDVVLVRAGVLVLHSAVAVRVQVDEPGADDQPGAVDLLRPVDLADLADGLDVVAGDVNVADDWFFTAAVVDGGVADDDVGVGG